MPLVAGSTPLEIAWLLRAFEGDDDAATGRALVAALEKSPAAASLPTARLRETLGSYPAEVLSAASGLLARAAPDDRQRAATIESFLTAAQRGDATRGAAVFFSNRAACSACHRVADRGEKIGPDLSRIGEVRTRRDLAEAILFPSASLARGYESYNVVTDDGRVHSGLLSRETATAVFLRTTERSEIRVERDAIEQFAPTATSVMPQGLDKVLSLDELGDVVAYLESLK